MGLVLDEPKDSDEKYEFDGVTYLVDQGLGKQAGDIKLDYLDNGYTRGFSITSEKSIGFGGGGGCGSSSCSC